MKDTILRYIFLLAVMMPCVLMFADNIWLQLTGGAYVWFLWWLRRRSYKESD